MHELKQQQADKLLRQFRDGEKGRLTVFLGAAPGVGKTYAMLSAAREQQQRGVDVLLGLVETHQRADTEQMLAGLPLLPRQQLHYRGTQLSEFDLDGALARRPQLLVLDELAHSNAPGSRHKRRYQDVSELLDAGIDVFTTMNIQHLESLNERVRQITGIQVRETVPDMVLDHAASLRLIDLAPAELLSRLSQGKVYLPDYIRAALDGFFSPVHLAALRELAMKKALQRVDNALEEELEGVTATRPTLASQRLLVLLGDSGDQRHLVRHGRQLAAMRQLPWTVLWLNTGKALSIAQHQLQQQALSLARELGAETDVLRQSEPLAALQEYLQQGQVSTLLLGNTPRRWYQCWQTPLYQQLLASGVAEEVCVYGGKTQTTPIKEVSRHPWWGNGHGHLAGLLAVAVVSPLAVLLQQWLSSGNLVLLFVLAIVWTGLKFGARPALTTALWSFLSFNFFLTDPRLSFDVHRHDDVATLIFLVGIGLISGPAASRFRHQYLLLRDANRYTDTLREVAQGLSVAEDLDSVWLVVSRTLTGLLHAPCQVVHSAAPHGQTSLTTPPLEQATIDWALQHGKAAGRFSDTLSAAAISVWPLPGEPPSDEGLLIRWHAIQTSPTAEEQALVAAILQLAAHTLKRINMVAELESARVKTEVEQLRSALLSSVSHDLKSPLAAMMGAAESLQLLYRQMSEDDRRTLLDTIMGESQRLERYIQNLLDMTRLGHGGLKIERDWVAAEDIIASALQRLRRYFPKVTVALQIQQQPLLYVHGALVEQALFNILENAARYTAEGQVIKVLLAADKQHCIFGIADAGPGIPPALREKIFDMFYVVAGGDQKKTDSGMGLAICRGMIAAHGGSVRVLDNPHGHSGAYFEVRLPLDYPDPERLSGEPHGE